MINARAMSVKKDKFEVLAPAKVNLYLEVLGERANGYHDIRSIMVPISLCDRITIEKMHGEIDTVIGTRGDIRDCAEKIASNGSNIATRAAEALKKYAQYRGGAHICIEKSIPLGGGLGGGSADAAAVLRGLNECWGLNMPVRKLMEIGSTIGCDIPGILYGGAVCVQGLGEHVTPVPMHKANGNGKWWLVLVNPGIHVSTKDIYTRCKTALTSTKRPITNAISALESGDVERAARGLFNGLEATVFLKYPMICMIAERLKKAGVIGSLLCGSGASVFGLARNEEHAREIAARFADNPGFPAWSRVVSTMPDGVIGSTRPFGGLSLGSSPSRAARVPSCRRGR